MCRRPDKYFDMQFYLQDLNLIFQNYFPTSVACPYNTLHTHILVEIKICFLKQVMAAKEALVEVMKGHFSLISHENHMTVIVSSYFTDDRGRTPFQISKKGFSIMAAFGWAFR